MPLALICFPKPRCNTHTLTNPSLILEFLGMVALAHENKPRQFYVMTEH